MANIGLSFFLLVLLLLSKVEARPMPATPISPLFDPNLPSSSISITSSSSSGASLSDIEDDGDSCKGLNREECLMRRSMVAHTDYIYTQDISTSTEP
ncbi:phytosulfokines 3-like [Argentina anserina]|uniref:phytosulfokines 3-like n=1 Tax=Argentina anserina TaxID=57926 RepID=UPI0021762AEF|nr:phytosulfokines 3-like [Potentilla anserina]